MRVAVECRATKEHHVCGGRHAADEHGWHTVRDPVFGEIKLRILELRSPSSAHTILV